MAREAEAAGSLVALVVDDMEDSRELVAERLTSAGFAVASVSDAYMALERIGELEPDVIVTDLQMPGQDGIALLRRIREFSDAPCIVITAYGSIATCEQAMRLGAQRFLQFRPGIEEVGQIARELALGSTDRKSPIPSMTLEQARDRRESEFHDQLRRLVSECNGNVSEISRRLQRDRSTVRYHLRRLGMTEPG